MFQNSCFKNFVLLIGTLGVCQGIYTYPAFATDPQQSTSALRDSVMNQKNRQDASTKYFSAVVSQFSKTTALPSNLATQIKDNHLFDNKQTPAQDVNGLLNFLRGLVYDSDHPTQFFDSLITMQNAVLSMQDQIISCGEKLAGAQNSFVVSIKQSRGTTLKYIQALKQQKTMVQQTAAIKSR